MNFLGPYKYVLDAVLIFALVAGAAFGIHAYNAYQQDIGAARVQQQWDAQEKQRSDAIAKTAAAAAATTAALQASANEQLRTKDAQISAINAHLQSALDGLRNRPDRPDPRGVPTDTGAQPSAGCTGAQLYRPDSEFLARQAARADRLLADLKQCQAAYTAAFSALNPN